MGFRIKTENVVASASLGVPVKPDKLVANLDGVEHEPEQLPDLVYRTDDPRDAFLLFGGGKIICTGGRSINDVRRAASRADKKLRDIKKS